MVAALDVLRQLELHVVAQVVEPELVVRSVRDVGGVGVLTLRVVQLVLDDAHRHAQKPVNLAHPLGVAPRQVVVRRDDVNALAFEGIQIGGQRRHQGLALAGLHLGDGAVVQHRAADQLDVEVPHVQDAAAGLAHDGKRLGHEVVHGLALGEPFPEFGRFGAKLFVRQPFNRGLKRVDGVHDRT